MKRFSIICDNKIEFTKCQKLLFNIGYEWNVEGDNHDEDKKIVLEFCIDKEFPIGVLINYKWINPNSFICDEKYNTEKYNDPFYLEYKKYSFKVFARKYKLEKLSQRK